MINIGDTVALVACSNGINEDKADETQRLVKVLENFGLKVKLSPYIYAEYSCFNGTPNEKAEALMKFFLDKDVKAIFDISGGDLANSILEYLDYDKIKNNNKPFFGYSDLSVILNALYKRSNIKTYNYQIRNLVGKFSEVQKARFKNTIINENNDLMDIKYKFIQGTSMEGIVVGGNIRCSLKLAGTEYMPDFNDKILFLESLGGDVAKMYTALVQFKNLGAFNKIKGILLGTFTEMERESYKPEIVDIVKMVVDNKDIPIAVTNELGHGQDSRCIVIGKWYKFNTK